MRQAAGRFQTAVDAVPFIAPVIPTLGNVDARPIPDANAIRSELTAQMTSPVRWRESVAHMLSLGAHTFLEFGPKDVLTGLLKRIDKPVDVPRLRRLIREVAGT